MEAFEGKWKNIKADKFEDYLKACGVSIVLRKVAAAASSSIEFKKEADGTWTFYFFSTVKNGTWHFGEVGKESEETTPDGRKVLSTITIDENGHLFHRQKAIKSSDKDSVIERWVEGDELHTLCTCDGVTATCVDLRQ